VWSACFLSKKTFGVMLFSVQHESLFCLCCFKRPKYPHHQKGARAKFEVGADFLFAFSFFVFGLFVLFGLQ